MSLISAQNIPDLFYFTQSTQQGGYLFENVDINGQTIEAEDWVGAFNGDICVGAKQWDTSLCNSGICEVVLMGDSGNDVTDGYMLPGDIPMFKIYDSSEDKYYDAVPINVELIDFNGPVIVDEYPWANNRFYRAEYLSYNTVIGCMDIEACNYNADATESDGSCEYIADDACDCSGNVFDCAGICGGNTIIDECGVCGGLGGDLGCGCDQIPDGFCDCDENILDCLGECGGVAYEDNCGQCDSDPNNDCILDCDGVWGGAAFIDDCGICSNGDTGHVANSDMDCNGECFGIAIADDCGVCDPCGDGTTVCEGWNAECWFVDVALELTNPLHSDINDNFNTFGMHPTASDDYNDQLDENYSCVSCYMDIVEPPVSPGDYVQFYFPHPEWENQIPTFYGTTKITQDIRSQAELGNIYEFIWNAKIKSSLTEAQMKLTFDLTSLSLNNYLTTETARIFVKRGDDYQEISLENNTYEFIFSGVEESLDIIVSKPEPGVEIIAPNGGEIIEISEDNNLSVELNYINTDFIDSLKLYLSVDNNVELIYQSDSVVDDELIIISMDSISSSLEALMASNDLSHDVKLIAKIIDEVGVDSESSYTDDSDASFTLASRNININLQSGWNLVTSPLGGAASVNKIFGNSSLVYNPDGGDHLNNEDIVNFDKGYYVDDLGRTVEFEGEVHTDGHTIFINKDGWSLIGNPIVKSIDLSYISISNNGSAEMNWYDAANAGLISPHPIVFDRSNTSHRSSNLFAMGQAFWINAKSGTEVKFNTRSNISGSQQDDDMYWSLSLIATKNNTVQTDYHNPTIGSEAVLGVGFSASDDFSYGEDQEQLVADLPFNRYVNIKLNNNQNASALGLYRDIRSANDELEWELVCSTVGLPDEEEINLSWDFSGVSTHYSYSLIRKDNDEIVVDDMLSTNEINLIANDFETTFIVKAIKQPTYFMAQNEFQISIGKSFSIPLEFVNPSSIDVEGIEFELAFDNIITIDSVSLNLLSGYEIQYGYTDSSLVASIYLIDAENGGYNGTNGEIVTLHGYVSSDENNIYKETEVRFVSLRINENISNSSNNFLIRVIEDLLFRASGNFIYYSNGSPIPNVQVGIDGYISALTDDNGFFSINGLEEGQYALDLVGKAVFEENSQAYFDGLSAVDASRIARYKNKKYSFNEYQKIAANIFNRYKCIDPSSTDSSGIALNIPFALEDQCISSAVWEPCQLECEASGGVLEADISGNVVSTVARYAAGLDTPNWNPNNISHWSFTPLIDSVDYSNSVQTVYDFTIEDSSKEFSFVGIRLGDVTGNWSSNESSNRKLSTEYFDLSIDIAKGELISLPLYLPAELEIEALDLVIEYDPLMLQFIQLNQETSMLKNAQYSTIINDKEGMIKIINFALSDLYQGKGFLGDLEFYILNDSHPFTNIKIAEMKVNEYSIGGILIDNSITRNISLQINNMPNNFMLYENYPNPFNPSTTIHFDLAIDGFVEIIIYNVKGEKVETLINENMPFGYHKIIWDASSYSSGMYFMKMLANEGKSSWTKKMLLVK